MSSPTKDSTATTHDNRWQIITAVWHVISTQGMAGVSMRTVAAAAEVSVGRIQYWFGTKDDLIEASLVAMLAAADDRHHPQSGTTGRDLDELRDLVGHPIPRAGDSPEGVAVFHHFVTAAINHPRLAALMVEAKQGQEREATRLLRRLRPGLPRARTAAKSLLAMADGLSMQVLIGSLSARTAQRLLHSEIDRVLG